MEKADSWKLALARLSTLAGKVFRFVLFCFLVCFGGEQGGGPCSNPGTDGPVRQKDGSERVTTYYQYIFLVQLLRLIRLLAPLLHPRRLTTLQYSSRAPFARVGMSTLTCSAVFPYRT